MTRQNYLYILALILLGFLLSSLKTNPEGMFFRYDQLDLLYHELAEEYTSEMTFKLDRELMQKASENQGFMQLSAYQAYCISTINNQPLTPVMEKSCLPVILLDQTRNLPAVNSFEDLLTGSLSVAIYNSDSDLVKWLVYVLSKNRGRSTADFSAGYNYFSELKKGDRLITINYRQDHDPLSTWLEEGADAIICWDYQAQYINRVTDHRYKIITPTASIPTVQYLVYRGEPVKPLPLEIKSLLAEQGYKESKYFHFGKSEELMKAYAAYKPDWRRQAMGTHRNTTASVNEKFILNALVLLFILCLNTVIFLRAKNRQRIFAAYLVIAGSLLMWQFLWLIKSLLWEDHDTIYMLLWYSAYPLIMSTAIAWRVVGYELRRNRPFPQKWLYAMIGMNIALSLLVFTNGLHHQVFVYTYGITDNYWYNDYTRNWGYWLFYAAAVTLLMIGLYDYFRYAVNRERRRQLIFFLLAIACALAINFIVVLEDKFKIFLDIAWQTSLLTAIFISLAIRNRFLEQGLDFAAILEQMHIPVAISLHSGKKLYQSSSMDPFVPHLPREKTSLGQKPEPVEKDGRYYQPEHIGFMGKNILLLHDISDQVKQQEAIKQEKALMGKTNELLRERTLGMETTLAYHGQLVLNDRISEVFDQWLKDLTRDLKEIRREGSEAPGNLVIKTKIRASRSSRLLRIMLWGLQEEDLSCRQMAELLTGESNDACGQGLDMVIAMKEEGVFPKKFAYGVFGCLVTLIDLCREGSYKNKLLVRVVPEKETVLLLVFLTEKNIRLDLLEEFTRSAAASYNCEDDEEMLNIRIIFGEEEGLI